MIVAPTDKSSSAKPTLGFVLLLSALAGMGPAAVDIYLPSLPSMARDFGAPAGQAELTVAAFLLGVCTGQLFHGPISDRIGRRPPLIAATALFMAASIGCVFAPSIQVLIGLRFLQALGSCAGIVLSRAIVRDLYDDRQTLQVLSVLMAVTGVAPVAAPVIGSMILLVGTWRTVFWILAGFGAILLVCCTLWLKESRGEATAIQARGESVLAAYRAVLGERAVLGYGLACGFAMAAMFTYIASSSNVIIGHYGLSPQIYSLVFATNALGIVGASILNRRLGPHYHVDVRLRRAGLFTLVCGVLMALSAWTGIGGLPGLLAPLFFVVANVGMVMPNTVGGALALDPRRSGAISAVVGAAPFALGATMAAITGALHDGTARPMASMIALCLALSYASLSLLPRRPSPAVAS
ncbi:MAG: multidrug effflux MFS transporter [Caulobacteraceae bacterium]